MVCITAGMQKVIQGRRRLIVQSQAVVGGSADGGLLFAQPNNIHMVYLQALLLLKSVGKPLRSFASWISSSDLGQRP